MDSLEMGESDRMYLKYMLLISDDLSFYTCLHKSNNNDNNIATDLHMKWISAFGFMTWIVSGLRANGTASVMKDPFWMKTIDPTLKSGVVHRPTA